MALKGKGLTLRGSVRKWALKTPLNVTGYSFENIPFLTVELSDGTHVGRGEAAGVYYLDDTPDVILAGLGHLQELVAGGINRDDLREKLPPGGARNAIDCALWDLEARQTGKPAWEIAGLAAPRPLMTTFTLSADAPDAMVDTAKRFGEAKALKLKLTGDPEDADRVRAVREARPDVWMAVDANQGFTRPGLEKLMPVLEAATVSLIEQPFPIGADALLDGFDSPVPIAADESVQRLADLPCLVGRFQVINIKLDKCGGLTEGLLMAQEAKELGLGVMVGNMMGTSLAMAPAYVLGQLCDIVDLDGPPLLKHDVSHAATYDGGYIHCSAELWGGGLSSFQVIAPSCGAAQDVNGSGKGRLGKTVGDAGTG